MTFFNLGEDGFEVGLFGVQESRKRDRGSSRRSPNHKVSSIHLWWIHGREGNADAGRCLQKRVSILNFFAYFAALLRVLRD